MPKKYHCEVLVKKLNKNLKNKIINFKVKLNHYILYK